MLFLIGEGTSSSSSSDVTGVAAGISVAIILAVASGIIVVVVVMWRQKKVMSSLLTITSQYIPPLSFSLQTRSRKPCPPSAVVPSASCTSFTKRSDEESGCGDQNGSSSEGSKRGDVESGYWAQNGSSSEGTKRGDVESGYWAQNGSSSEGTKRGDVESGYWAQNGGSGASSLDSNTPLIEGRLAEDGSATQAEEKEGKYAVVVPLKSGNRFLPCVDPTAVVYSELNIRATHVS